MSEEIIKVRYDELGMFPAAEIQDKLAVVRDGLPGNVSLAQIIALFADGAPEALDTWLEVVAKLADNDDALAALVAALAAKADSANVAASLALKQNNSGELFRGHLNGLTLSNNAIDATNDIDIAPGSAGSDGTVPVLMTLSSVLTKRLDAAWAEGSGNGGLDTGSIANATYHVWLIQRSDTGVVDALFSTSATSPTMPTNYDRKAYIAPIVRASGAILGFTQVGRDTFILTNPGLNSGTINTTAGLFTLIGCPTGVKVLAEFIASIFSNTANIPVFFSSATTADGDPGVGARASLVTAGSSAWVAGQFRIVTDTSGRFRVRSNAISISSFGTAFTGFTLLR